MAAPSAGAVVVQVNGEGEMTRLSNVPGSGPSDEPKGAQPEAVKEGLCARPLTTIPTATLMVAAVVVLVLGLVSLAAGNLLWAAGIIGAVGSGSVGLYLLATGGLRAQLNRFKQENDKLSKTSTALEGDVNKLEVVNQKVQVQVDKLNSTVDELQGVSSSLQNDLGAFSDLREAMETFAKETGENMSEALGNINGVYDRMHGLTLENERALLQRVAQDLEFMDRDKEMSKMEFQRFLQRIPTQFKERFERMGLTFESIAGEDHEIDFKEMGALIEKLLAENADQQQVTKERSLAAGVGQSS